MWADASTFSTYQVSSVSDNRFGKTEVLIDNAADVSIVHPSLLQNITNANILSFTQVEDRFPITYKLQDSFTVHLPHVDVVGKMECM